MMFESPGKITNLNFQTKGSSGEWITQYTLGLDSQPTYEMVCDWLRSFSRDLRFSKVSQFRLTTIQEKKHKNEDGTSSIEKKERVVLGLYSFYLNKILENPHLITVQEGSSVKVYADKSSSLPSFKDFWKEIIWADKDDELIKVTAYSRTPEDNGAEVYKLAFKSGRTLTIGCWITSPE